MKNLILCALSLISFFAGAQSNKAKTEVRQIKVEHVLKESKKTAFGFELSIFSGNTWKDDSIKTIEICFPDSSITFASILYPEYKIFKKGELLKNTFYVVGDSIAAQSKVAPMGTYKEFYPKMETGVATASIMFLIDIDSIPGDQYMLPDLNVSEGQIAIGDTIALTDNQGKKCVAKVNYLDITNKELNSTIVVPFVIPAFYDKRDQVRVVMYYSVLSGDPGMHEGIQLFKL